MAAQRKVDVETFGGMGERKIVILLCHVVPLSCCSCRCAADAAARSASWMWAAGQLVARHHAHTLRFDVYSTHTLSTWLLPCLSIAPLLIPPWTAGVSRNRNYRYGRGRGRGYGRVRAACTFLLGASLGV